MPTAPQPLLPPSAGRKGKSDKPDKDGRKPNWRERKADKQKYYVTMMLAFVFGMGSIAMVASNPFGGVFDKPNPSGSPSQDPAAAELKGAQSAVDANPKDPSTHFNLGETFYKQKKWDMAAAEYRKTLDLDSSNIMAMSHLGTVLLNQDKLQDALPILEKAQSIEKQQVAARKARPTSTPAEGEAPVEEADLRDINVPERLYQAYTETHQRDKAIAALKEARDIDLLHANDFVLERSVALYIDENNKDAGAQYLEDGVQGSARIADKFKQEIYRLAIGVLMTSSMDKKHPEKEARGKDWLKLFGEDLAKFDPAGAKVKLGDNKTTVAEALHNMTEPPPPPKVTTPKAGSSAAPSAAPASPESMPSAAPGSPASPK